MKYNDKVLNFYVIYAVDVPNDCELDSYLPRESVMLMLDRTEDDDEYQYDYLEGCWEDGHHGKWVGELTSRQFEQFIWDTYMGAEDVETGGSLTGFGWLPAISFSAKHYSPIVSAYVTPFIPDESLGDDDWDTIRDMILEEWG